MPLSPEQTPEHPGMTADFGIQFAEEAEQARYNEEQSSMYSHWERGSEERANPGEEEKTWVTIREAVERTGYHPVSIRVLIHRDQIPCERREEEVEVTYTRRQTAVYIPLEDLLEWKARPKPGRRPGRPRRE